MGDILFQVFYIVAMVSLGLGLSLLRQWLMHYLSVKTEDEIERVARNAVAAAEQFIVENPEKLEWASSIVHQKFPFLGEQEVRMYIEKAVFDLNQWLNGAEE